MVTEMFSSAEESALSCRRLTSFFKPPTSSNFINCPPLSNSTHSCQLQWRNLKRKSFLLPRLLRTTLEKSLTSNDSEDCNGPHRKFPWDEWRRQRSKSRGTSHSSQSHIHEIESEKENVPSCKFLRPNVMTRSRILSLPPPKRLPPTALRRQSAFKGKRPSEPSLDDSADGAASNSEDTLTCSFLPPIVRGIVANAMGSKKKTEIDEKAAATAKLRDPINSFHDHNEPGLVFGAALEDQIPSPDFPNLPLLLHVTIAALESRGLNFVGLYRAPGRQSEIDEFVRVSNTSSLNPRLMLSLPTWNDIKALTGVIKLFLRRLPEPLCDPQLWGNLADTLPHDTQQITKASHFATLRGIRANLMKGRGTSGTIWPWRFATMDFLFNHLRRIVALEEANSINFKCIAICFGPSLFHADSQSQTKFNVLLELMLQHWPWLKAELNREFPSRFQSVVAYVEDFLENGPDLREDFREVLRLRLTRSGNEILGVVQEIFDRTRRCEN